MHIMWLLVHLHCFNIYNILYNYHNQNFCDWLWSCSVAMSCKFRYCSVIINRIWWAITSLLSWLLSLLWALIAALSNTCICLMMFSVCIFSNHTEKISFWSLNNIYAMIHISGWHKLKYAGLAAHAEHLKFVAIVLVSRRPGWSSLPLGILRMKIWCYSLQLWRKHHFDNL